MIFIRDKKGVELIMSLWWYFMVVLVIGVLYIVTGLFFGADIDIRQSETEIMNQRIYDCIVDNNRLKTEISNLDLFDYCSIAESSYFYFNITLKDENKNILGYVYSDYDSTRYQTECLTQLNSKKILKAEKWSKCFLKEYVVLYEDSGKLKKGYLEILTSSDNHGERV